MWVIFSWTARGTTVTWPLVVWPMRRRLFPSTGKELHFLHSLSTRSVNWGTHQKIPDMSLFRTATGLAMLIHCDLLSIFEGWPFVLKTGEIWSRSEYTCLAWGISYFRQTTFETCIDICVIWLQYGNCIIFTIPATQLTGAESPVREFLWHTCRHDRQIMADLRPGDVDWVEKDLMATGSLNVHSMQRSARV
jgi:hypothetical protein